MTKEQPRSSCPITCALDLLGDRWTLVVLRDVLLLQRRHFTELASAEGIATNILSDRLERLEDAGVLARSRDDADGRRRMVVPTDKGRALIPILLELAIWGYDHGGGTARAHWVERGRTDRDELIAQLQSVARENNG